MAEAKVNPNDVALQEGQQMLALWVSIKASLQKALVEEEVRPNDEMQFLDAKAELSKYLRAVMAKVPNGVNLPMNQIQEILRQATSIGNLRATPKTDRIGLLAQWHSVFVQMCRAVGAFQFIKEGYVPSPKIDAKTAAKNKGNSKFGGKPGAPPKKH
jgi:hypothetical protein